MFKNTVFFTLRQPIELARKRMLLNLECGFGFLQRVNDNDRGIGKTTLLNEIGLEYQALGYKVFVLSNSLSVSYNATDCIDNFYDSIHYSNAICLIDEINLSDVKKLELINKLDDRGVLLVGFYQEKNL